MKLTTVAVMVGLLWMAPARIAGAFWSYGLPSDSNHQNITKQVLSTPFTLPNRSDLPFAPEAIAAINRAHREVDDPDFYSRGDHFDDEQLALTLLYMKGRRNRLVELLALPSPPQPVAWELLGQILHSAQDFYSHSTWSYAGNGSAFNFGPKTLPDSDYSFYDPSGTVCDGDDVVGNPPLSTGYYKGTPTPERPNTCRHGALPIAAINCVVGPNQQVVDGINLDSLFCAPLGRRYKALNAFEMAQEETKLLVQSIIDELKSMNNSAGICVLMGHPEIDCGASASGDSEQPPPALRPDEPSVVIVRVEGTVTDASYSGCPWFSYAAIRDAKGGPFELEIAFDQEAPDSDPGQSRQQYKQVAWIHFHAGKIDFTTNTLATVTSENDLPYIDGGLRDYWSYVAKGGPVTLSWVNSLVVSGGEKPQMDLQLCQKPPTIPYLGGYSGPSDSFRRADLRCGSNTFVYLDGAAYVPNFSSCE